MKAALARCYRITVDQDVEVPCTIVKEWVKQGKVLVRFETIDREYIKGAANVRLMPSDWTGKPS